MGAVSRTRSALLAATLLAAGGAVVLPAHPAGADEGSGRIAFDRLVDYTDAEGFPRRASDVFAAEPDGTGVVNLTASDAVDDIQPAWSPDGSRIAFSSNRDGNYDIWTMAADGSDLQQVTFTYGIEYDGGYVDLFSSFEPTWSPDGARIAFTGYRGSSLQAEVFLADVGQSEPAYAETMVTDPADSMNSAQPDWSPDGTTLVLNQYFDSYSTDLWTIGTDGAGATNLTGEAGFYVTDLDPSWSPDGTRITWVSNRDATDVMGAETDVYVMRADGTGVVRATTDPDAEYDPEFSPDGLRLLYQRNYYDPEIWVVDAPAPPETPAGPARLAGPRQVGAGGAPSWQRAAATATLTVSVTGEGRVGSRPAGIACGRDCTASLPAGTRVVLTATAWSGHRFAGWSGACSGTGTCVVDLDAARTVTARFARAAGSRPLTVTTYGQGSVASDLPGIRCGSDCAQVYAGDAAVTLTATPRADQTFLGWDGACSGTGTCTVETSTARRVTASFTPSLVLTVTRTGPGRVASRPAGIACGADCTEAYAAGTPVTLVATPATGHVFAGWSGACTGTGPCTVTLRSARTVRAVFR